MSTIDAGVFVVDADVWIRAHGARYPPDVFPALWRHLKDAVELGRICSPRQVLGELGNEKKGIGAWARTLKGLVLKESPSAQRRAGEIVQKYANLLHGASHDAADPWLVAHAQISGYVVVTEEGFSNNFNKPKIPNVCKDLNVECINTVAMLRQLRICI